MIRPAYSFCVCPDSALLKVRIDGHLSRWSPPGADADWQRYVFWGDEGLPPSFWEHLTLQGLFALPKALVIRHAQNIAADGLRRLFSAIGQLAPSKSGSLPNPLIWPFVCLEVGFEKGKPKVPVHIQKHEMYPAAEKNGRIDAEPGLTAQTHPP